MQVTSYKDLVVWQHGVKLSLEVYRLTARFPDTERFGLTSQMCRCAVAIPSNIAEGHARRSTREYVRHVSIALGSLAELETQLHISTELKIADQTMTSQIAEDADRLGKQLRALVKSLEIKLNESRL
jgi:four helix bundle protein